jgi:prepilin-type processing-associated H-X9-DG protein
MSKASNKTARTHQRGFTRVDLCAVVAITLLLGVTQLRTLGGTRSAGEASVCANNLRRLIQAWSMYADDHAGRLVPNQRVTVTWSEGWLDFSLFGASGNLARLVDPTLTGGRTGLLGPYLKRNASVFKCPADREVITIFGRPFSSIRSVAMNNWMGGDARPFQDGFKVFRHRDEITRPAPDRALVFIETRDLLNDGVFAIDMLPSPHLMPPAARHDGGAQLAFADGHVAYRAWVDPRTSPPPPPRGGLGPIPPPMLDNPDLDYLRQVATAPK